MPKIWDDTVAKHKDRSRRAILDAAVELAGERGRHEVSMAAIAERAGIGRATIYNYFPDVDHIFAAYAVDQFDQHHRLLDERTLELPDPLDRLRTTIEVVVEYFGTLEHRAGSAVGITDYSPSAQLEVDQAFASLHERLTGLVGDAVAAGELRADLEPVVGAHVLNALLGSARMLAMSGEGTPSAVASLVFDLFLHGAGPR